MASVDFGDCAWGNNGVELLTWAGLRNPLSFWLCCPCPSVSLSCNCVFSVVGQVLASDTAGLASSYLFVDFLTSTYPCLRVCSVQYRLGHFRGRCDAQLGSVYMQIKSKHPTPALGIPRCDLGNVGSPLWEPLNQFPLFKAIPTLESFPQWLYYSLAAFPMKVWLFRINAKQHFLVKWSI